MRKSRFVSHHRVRMWKKQIGMFMTAVLLSAQVLYGITAYAAQAAAEISNQMNILTTATMAVYNDDQYTEPVTGTVYKQQSKVLLNYNWELPDGHGYKAGDTFTFDLPDAFKLYNDVTGELKMPDVEGNVGTFTAYQSNHKVVMTFNDYIEQNYGVHGTLAFKTEFKEYAVTEESVQEIKLPINGVMETISLVFQPKGGTSIAKKGEVLGYNAKSISWTVDVNTSLAAITGAVVSDPIPAGLGEPQDVKVNKLNVTMGGAAGTLGETVTEGVYYAYSYDAAGRMANIAFLNPIDSAYRITFTTPITDFTKTSFENKATLTGTGPSLPKSATATVSPARGAQLDKSSGTYNQGDQSVEWTVKVNYDERASAGTQIEDWFSANQTLDVSNIKVYPVTFPNANGSGPKQGTALNAGTDYTVTGPLSDPSRPGQTGFRVTFNGSIDKAYNIVYKTKASGRVYADSSTDSSQTVTNTVYFNGTEKTASKKLESGILTKTITARDYNAKTVSWKITVNNDKKPDGTYYTMQNAVVTDTFSLQGLTLDEGSLVVKGNNKTLDKGTDYTVAPKDGDYANGFVLVFAVDLTGPCTITYSTGFDLANQTAGGKMFPNAAHVAWTENSTPHEQSVSQPFDPNAYTKNNGFKNGSYDAVKKELNWEVGFNYNLWTLQNAVVRDVIEAPQKLIDQSVKVYAMTIAPDGHTTKGAEITSGFTVTLPDAANGNALTVAFDQPISEGYYLVYKTSLENVLVDTNASDTANLYDGAVPKSENLTASVNIPYKDEYVSKSGAQSGDRINWSININRNQSTIEEAVITDTGSANQMFVQDSFKVYNTVVSQDSSDPTKVNITKASTLLQKGTDYTIVYSEDQNGKPVFVLSFLKIITVPYILEYQTLVIANNNETVSNIAQLSGTNVTTTKISKPVNVVVKFSSGEGTGSGGITNAKLTVVKKDAVNAQQPLAGAEFELYRKSGSGEIYVDKGTTNAQGELVFTRLYGGNYVLKEVKAPTGYRLDSAARNITLNSAAVTTVVTNEKLPVVTPTPTPTATPTATPTPTPTATPTATPTPTPTPTATPTPTPTPDDNSGGSGEEPSTPSPTPSVSSSASPTPSVTVSPTPQASTEPSVSPTPSATPEPGTPEPTLTPSPSPTPITEITDQDTPKGGSVPVPEGGKVDIGKPPEHGTLSLDDTGNWLYTPDPGYTGKDSFTVNIVDKDGNGEELLIEMDVEEVPLGGLNTPAPEVATLPKTGEERRLLWQLTGIGLLVAGVSLRRFRLKR